MSRFRCIDSTCTINAVKDSHSIKVNTRWLLAALVLIAVLSGFTGGSLASVKSEDVTSTFMASKRGKAKQIGHKMGKQRATSNVFSMFDKNQILELKEVFKMIDQDCDGFIDKKDLLDMFHALGEENIAEDYVGSMIKESPSYINLTMFLTLFGNKLNGTDPDDIFEEAFRCLDASGSGRVHGETLKTLLTQTGDK